MYLRITERRNRDGSAVSYYALAENVWNAQTKRSEAQVIHSFGRADQLDKAALQRLVASIQRVLDADAAGAIAAHGKASIPDIEIEAVYELGVVFAARTLWEDLGIGAAIRSCIAEGELSAPHEMALFAMAAQRLDDPRSKLGCASGGCPISPGCRRPGISPCISSTARSTSSPSGPSKSNVTCSCARLICSASMST
jgi:hypothetical protein